jgi:ParB family chromosome partitioning protein
LIEKTMPSHTADAPFDRDDATLNPAAGACTTCTRRSGYNTALFPDAISDQCLDAKCHAIKIATFLDRAIAARPELVHIEDGWRRAKEQRPGAVHRGHFREIEAENPDAEPPCAAAKPAIIVYGKRIGTMLTVCTDDECPVHDPRTAESQSQITEPAPVMEPAGEDQAEDAAQAEEPDRETQQRRKDYQAEQERKAEARKQELERRQQEYEAQQTRRDELRKARAAQFDRILAHAPATFTAAQLRVFLRALIHLDAYTLIDDLAAHFTGDDENDQRCAEEVLLDTIGGLADDQLTGFALRLALTGHTALPNDGEIDFLAEAEAALVIPKPSKPASAKKTKPPAKTTPKKKAAKKKVAA